MVFIQFIEACSVLFHCRSVVSNAVYRPVMYPYLCFSPYKVYSISRVIFTTITPFAVWEQFPAPLTNCPHVKPSLLVELLLAAMEVFPKVVVVYVSGTPRVLFLQPRC